IILTSELNTLFKFDIDKTIDEDALNLFFRLTYMPAPTTILRRAYKILPGQLGVITEEGATFKKYYRIERQPFVRMGFSQAAEELHSRLTIAVKDRMISDVPVGTFLSGGLDSSIVSA